MPLNTNGHTPLQKCMRVSFFNIILNLLLVLCKAAAGIFAHSTVLVSDALHSGADTLCTVLVLSGLGYEAKHPGTRAKKVQGGIIAVLAAAIGATGMGMLSGAVRILCGHRELPPDRFALVMAVLCVAVKAAMYINTKRIAGQSRNDCLLADAFHHRADCMSSLLVVSSVLCARLQWAVPDAIARIALGLFLLASAYSIAKDGIALLRVKNPNPAPISQSARK